MLWLDRPLHRNVARLHPVHSFRFCLLYASTDSRLLLSLAHPPLSHPDQPGLPVIESGRLIGIVTEQDFIVITQWLLEERLGSG